MNFRKRKFLAGEIKKPVVMILCHKEGCSTAISKVENDRQSL